MAKIAFAVVAHPDDIEFVMAGTLMLLKDVGYELHYMNIANGCCGSTQFNAVETARIRRNESRRAAEYLGAVFHESLTNDLEIFYQHDTLLRLASIMREVAPEILLVHSPEDYMEDHMNACRLAVTAAFTRGMPNYPVVPPRPAIQQDITVYHAQPHGNCDGLRRAVEPDLLVAIDSVIDRKERMLAFHASQKDWLDESQGMDSYLIAMRDLSRSVAQLATARSCEYAEGWRRHSHLGFCSESSDPLQSALRPFVLHP